MLDINREIERSAESVALTPRSPDAKVYFVCPDTDTLPDDGVFNYAKITSVYDFKSVQERSVLTISRDQIAALKCVVDNAAIFGVQLMQLAGVPMAEYTSAFESTTWSLEKVAYAPMLAELRLAQDIDAQLAVQNATTHDRERAAYVRKTGNIKEQAKFDVADTSSHGGAAVVEAADEDIE